MISNIFALLLSSGLASMIFFRERYSRFLSLLLLVMGGVLLFNFYENWQFGTTHSTIYRILEYKKLYLDIDLSSSAQRYALILPFFVLGICSLYNTLFSSQEEQRGHLSSLIMIDISFLILLACSNNLLLLLAGSALMGVVGLYIINNFESKKTYIFYNLTADMALFTAFCIIYASQGSVSVNVLPQYLTSGSHVQLSTALILLGVAIKSGLFMFHNQIFSYRDLNFNRLIFLNYCVTPAAGLLLFAKMLVLFTSSDLIKIIVYVLAGASMLYGFLGALIYDNIKEKALSLNVLLWGFIYGYAISAGDFSLSCVGWILFLFYLLNAWLQLVVSSFSDEIYISKMGGSWRRLISLQAIGILLAVCLFQRLDFMNESINTGKIWLQTLSGGLLIVVPYVFRQIFYGETHCDERVWAFLKNPGLITTTLFGGLCIWIICQCGYFSWILVAVALFCVAFIWFNPLRFLADWYERDEIQLSEFFEHFYEYVVVAPLNILGRILWLTVDFLLIERTIINSFSNVTGVLIRVSEKIHTPRAWEYVIMTAAGLLIMFIFLQVKP